ncbi:flagellar filament capping protein FliD [Paenibacillus illinoisensis]|uniref:Flagellar hook-associated protein 2 n=1 Tax=Paenibacillus illinoisensis TaxID=59845 RepID=A0A2W0CN19_9BACL|nr:flagellar filament capping protein FliD [Paenibacillus illinoisensis]PYY29575.1 Flagellar hook-associated protein 2 [Paenibacillus illinoisensis]
MSNIKLSGMVSGLDTDTIIKQLMQVERAPLDKLTQQKQKIAWKRDEYREMNTMLTSIRSLADKMRFSTSFNKQSATSSNTSVVTATASSTAASGSYAIQVDKLASSALVTGSTVSVNSTKSTVTADGAFTIEGANGKSVNINVTAGSTTYDAIIKQVNAANIGVTLSFDSINKRFMASTSTTGENATIQITGTGASELGFASMTSPQKGSDASVQVNGQTMTFANNAFELNGVRFDLKGVSTTATSVTIAKDTSSVVDQIKGFVDQYNTLVDKVNEKTKAVPNRNYVPLTDEQKESMTEKQIDLWESKAKTGLLYRDDILTDALASLRSALINKVDGLSITSNGVKTGIDTLSDIGITFKKYTPGMAGDLGKLELDETKLKDAIASNPDGVMNLFTKTSSLDPKDKNYQKESGIGERLYSTLNTQINKIMKRIGSGTVSDAADSSQLGEQIRGLNSRMDVLKTRMQAAEDRYYKQFTAMELALQKLNSKGSWLSSQLGQ